MRTTWDMEDTDEGAVNNKTTETGMVCTSILSGRIKSPKIK